MINKNKIFLIGTLCLAGLAGFMVATNNADTDQVIDGFKSTTDGSYFTKNLRVAEEIKTPKEEAETEKQKPSGGAYVETPVPDDLSNASILAWLDGLNICDTRKNLIRNGISIREQAYYSINHHNNWTVDNLIGKGIECSGFIAWSCRMAGINAFGAPTTAGIAPNLILTDDPKPGDFGNVTAAERKAHGVNASYGHIGIYLGKQANGTKIYLHAGGETAKATPTPYVSNHAHIADWGHTYVHPDIKAADDIYAARGGGSSNQTGSSTAGTNTVGWSDSWQFAKSTMKHPSSLNKYVPDNYNGKTVFINPGHGDGSALSSEIPNDPFGVVNNQYAGSSSRGHTSGTSYTTSAGNKVTEAQYVLDVAKEVKDKLLAKGYAVVMARESLVNNFENSARSVFANNVADIHVAIHIDAGTHGPSWYRPSSVQSAHQNYVTYATQAERLGTAIENACATTMGKPAHKGLNGTLTGYSYSTIPCVYIELMGVESKEMADFADTHKTECADGIVQGIDDYFR